MGVSLELFSAITNTVSKCEKVLLFRVTGSLLTGSLFGHPNLTYLQRKHIDTCVTSELQADEKGLMYILVYLCIWKISVV